jgi:division protein CdvB (Snf7/Vps24/ESCRT-III family)
MRVLIIFKRKADSRYDLVRLLYYLKLCHGRVSYLLSKVESKIEGIKDKVNYLGIEGSDGRRLLKEVDSLVNLAKSLAKMSAILEVLITRVETLTIINLTVKDLTTIKEVVKELRNYAQNIPEISIIVEDIEDKVNDLIHETRGSFRDSEVNIVAVNDAKNIIREAELIAEEKLKSLSGYPIKT